MRYKEARIKNMRCEDRRKRRWKTTVEKPPLRVSQICAYALSIEVCVSQIYRVNKYMQKAGEPENDAGFLKHVTS